MPDKASVGRFGPAPALDLRAIGINPCRAGSRKKARECGGKGAQCGDVGERTIRHGQDHPAGQVRGSGGQDGNEQ